MKPLFVLSIIFLGLNSQSFAYSYDYFPENTVMAFKGQALGTDLDCYLYVTEVELNSPNKTDLRYVKIHTNYSYNQEETSETIVTPVRENLLAGISMNNTDQIVISYDSKKGIESVRSFALKWMKNNEETLSYCLDLQYLPRQ